MTEIYKVKASNLMDDCLYAIKNTDPITLEIDSLQPKYLNINFLDGTVAQYKLDKNDGTLQDFLNKCQKQHDYEKLLKECYEQLSYVNRDLNFFLDKSREDDLKKLLENIEKSLDKSLLDGYNETIIK